MRLAYFSPVSPQKTGISDFTEREMLPYLSKHAEIDVFIDKGIEPSSSYLKENYNIYPYTDYPKRKDSYDIPLYQMGNNVYHEFVYNTLMDYPGITVLHDLYLHGYLGSVSLARGDGVRYASEFEYCYGAAGVAAAHKAMATRIYPEFDYPLIKRVVDHSLGVVCQSEFGANKALIESPGSIVREISHPYTMPGPKAELSDPQLDQIRSEAGLEGKSPVITSFGFIAGHKRYAILLRAFKAFLECFPSAALFLVGQDLMGIDRLIADLGIGGSVIRTGYAPASKTFDYLAISDFCVNLRFPTTGEASGSVLRIMSMEKPVIVSNVGWFSQLPDSCCLKLDVDRYEVEMLVEYMRLLAADPELRKRMGANARRYVQNQHDPERVAEEYCRFIGDVISGNAYIINKAYLELMSLGVSENDYDLMRCAAEKLISFL